MVLAVLDGNFFCDWRVTVTYRDWGWELGGRAAKGARGGGRVSLPPPGPSRWAAGLPHSMLVSRYSDFLQSDSKGDILNEASKESVPTRAGASL